MKDKESNQNYKVPILLLIGVVIAVLIVCYLVIDVLIDFKNAKEVLPIIISVFGLFATFGGAYFGASIAGKYTLNAVEKQNQKEQNRKNEKFKNKITLAIIRIEDEATRLSEHLKSYLDSDDTVGLKESTDIVDTFAKPLTRLSSSDEIYESDKEFYMPMLRYISMCNRLYNYSQQSFSYSESWEVNVNFLNGYRDVHLTGNEIRIRDENNKTMHPYFAEATAVFEILVKELEDLKGKVLEVDLYNTIESIDGEYFEQRIYKIGTH